MLAKIHNAVALTVSKKFGLRFENKTGLAVFTEHEWLSAWATLRACFSDGSRVVRPLCKERVMSTVKTKSPTSESSKEVEAASLPATGKAPSKQSVVIDLLRREEGATVAQIIEATGWQKHSVRGFIAGTAKKKFGMMVKTGRGDAGLVYRGTMQ